MQTNLVLRTPACPVAGTRRKVVTRAGPGGEREPWDFGRFVNTVTFFNQGLLQKTLQGTVDGVAKALSFGTQQAGLSASPQPVPVAPLAAANDPLDPVIPVPVEGVILVTGATGGVGQRVVRKLLAAGKTVRALVRDMEKGRQLLSGLPAAPGAQLQIVAADLTQPRTLLPEYLAGVRAVVSCAAVKVQPKEGDDNRRSKYMQGIKFYDPEIVGDTPEAVELRGMQNLLSALGTRLGRTQGLPLLQMDGSGTAWGALDDVVMGGVSKSRITRVEGAGEDGGPAMVFSGLVSTSNAGGFASVRCRNFEPALDLTAFTGIELRLKGNGQRFKCILRPDDNWDGISYCRSFDTQPGVWQTIHIPFHEFFPVFRARTLKDAAPLDPSSISSVQLMLSKFEYDGELNPAFTAGEFELPITRLAAYMEQPAPRFVHVSSAFVTRPTRPGIDLEQEPPVVKLNSMLGGVLDFKLAGEDTLRASGVPFAIVRPCALTEEPRGMPLEFDQGDMIRGKMSREDLSELCCALLSEPSLQGTTFEVRSKLPSTSQPWQVDPASPPPVRDWSAELRAANLVPGVTGKTIDGVYTGKQPEAQFTSSSRPLVSSR